MTTAGQTSVSNIVDIKHRWSGKVLFSAEIDATLPWGARLGAAVKIALKSGADLRGADLTYADLTRADLTGADLNGVDLRDAVLAGADLTRAVLRRAVLTRAVLTRADLAGADLRGAVLTRAVLTGADLAGADLTRAVLTGADLTGADLAGADLNGAVLTDAVLTYAVGLPLPTPEEAAARIRAVAQAALASDDALHMADWHKCETSHCIAGWAVHLAGPVGYVLEKAVGAPMAGLMLLGVEAHSHFCDSDATAKAWLKSKLEPVT